MSSKKSVISVIYKSNGRTDWIKDEEFKTLKYT